MVSVTEVRARLKPSELKLPDRPRVLDIYPVPYVDSLGERELVVFVLLDESTTDEERTWPRLQPIHEEIHRRLQSLEDAPYPYVRFRKQSELDAKPDTDG
jgi:hypothetical protein